MTVSYNADTQWLVLGTVCVPKIFSTGDIITHWKSSKHFEKLSEQVGNRPTRGQFKKVCNMVDYIGAERMCEILHPRTWRSKGGILSGARAL